MWNTLRQERTARSSSEAEIKATDELTKRILALRHVMQDILLPDATKSTNIWNDNRNCVDWALGTIQKAVRHVNIRDAAIRDSIRTKEITITHIDGKLNPADLFTKEMRYSLIFISTIRDCIKLKYYNFLVHA